MAGVFGQRDALAVQGVNRQTPELSRARLPVMTERQPSDVREYVAAEGDGRASWKGSL